MSLENGKTAAHVRDGALIVEFGGSSQPFIWRYDLTKVHAVLFRVQSENGAWQLGLEGPKGEFTPVTTFASEIKAKAALSVIAAALRSQNSEKRAVGRLANAAFALLVILIIAALAVVVDMGRTVLVSASRSSAAATETVAVKPTPQGQAVSADQALQAPAPRP